MKTNIETVEILADVVARQSHLITALYGVIVQLNAADYFSDEVAEIQRFVDECVGPVD